ncbi:glycosyltransferase family 4 protein [Brucella grignonensis]|uniref:Glycosyl transferases group 1 family protein n=1 Tax=Brucella grignonensis TaxID=94627 RepID=A0A256FME2_9HYPH|nr:glycosyltransferase family 1 protein [Brucella grignonensis]NKB83716.1 glycosyltransferase family 1 protein [Brucella grignonensis]OYR15989.1 glycosyl transferases group 1 family protein [Brucella grignonensis]
MKKLVIVTDAWHPQVNGVVRTLAKCCELMTERGYEVIVISPQDYRSVPCPTYPEIRLALTTPPAFRRKLARLNPDYVHIATEGPLGFMARRACIKMGWSFTTSFHTRFPEYLRDRFPIPPKWTYAFLRRFHNAASHTLVPTQSILDDLQGRGFTGLELWTRGVDRTLFHPRDDVVRELPQPVFICVGRVATEKNLPAFLELDLPGTKLIVGDGPALDDLKSRFPKAVFVGKKEGKDLARIYASADIFVFPSRTDTFGLVLLEAISSGLPVAAFPVPGSADVIGATRAGILSDDLHQACLQALEMPTFDPAEVLKPFTWKACADILENVLSSTKSVAQPINKLDNQPQTVASGG